jgi:hypothetical protein
VHTAELTMHSGGRRAHLDPARPTLAAAVVFAVLSLALVAPALVPGHTLSASDYLWGGAPWQSAKPAGVGGLGSNYEEADAVLVFQPFTQWARGELPGAPLWNPHIMAGRPFVANAQSALFSPFTWPSLILPFWWSLGIVAALKLFAAAMGTYLLARRLGIGFAGGLLSGIAFAFSLSFVVWLSWPLSSVWAWLPWLWLGVWETARRPGIRPLAGLALAVALQFAGGHPESSFHSLATAALFALLALSRSGDPKRGAGRLLGGVVLGGLLAAVFLLPFAELLRHSNDLTTREGRAFLTLEKRFLLGFFLPDYWGRPSGAQIDAFLVARAFYVGALPLMLAAWALLRRTRERMAIAGIAALALAVVVGVPVIKQIAMHLPGFDTAYNTRLIVPATLAIALLAGWGLGDLIERVERPRLLVGGALGLFLLPFAAVLVARSPGGARFGDALKVAWGFAKPPPMPAAVDVLPWASLLVWLVLGGLAVALLIARARGLGAGPFAAAALVLVVLDLFRIGMGNNPAIPTGHAEQPATPAIKRVQAARPARFAGLQPPLGLQPIVPDLAMRYGLFDARGYDYPVERRYDRLWRQTVAGKEGFTPPTMQVTPTDRALRTLGLLGVTDLVAPPHERRRAGLRVTYDGDDARIYANPHALPRTWVVGAQRTVRGDAAIGAVTDPGFDPRTTAIVEQPVAGLSGGGSSRIVRYEPERVELRARADGRGLVMLSDVWFPGWKATVDGRDVPIHRVDYLLRGVQVGPGEHTIVMTYQPWSWRIGWIVSLTCALLLLGALWKSARR